MGGSAEILTQEELDFKGKTCLWEILVPVEDNFGVEFELAYHREWDSKVRALTGGLTIMKTAKGQWVSGYGQIFFDEMIPVRVSCSRETLERVLAMTKSYYRQEAIFCFKVSEEVIIYE